MLQKLFRSLTQKKTAATELQPAKHTSSQNDGWHTPLSASELLDTPLRQQYLTTIWQNVSMSPEMFNTLYRVPIEKYAEMVQLLPASESHHHSHLGGMLDHGLEVISIATKLRQSYILPQNAIPEEQAKQRDVWTAVIIYSALLHDIAKCAVDIEIILKSGERWFPWQGVPNQPYNFRYIKGRDYDLHPAMGGFFAGLLIPKVAFDWIAPFSQAFSNFMYFISAHTDKAGIISDIIQRADQISVTMAIGGDPAKLEDKPKTSFAKQLFMALRQVVTSYKFNSQQGGCDGWLTDDGLWVMSKSTADNIRAILMRQGIAVPSQNGKLFDELQAHKLIDSTSEGKAIWSCKVTSNEGWTHDKPFSLLKIAPQTIWDDLEQRPQLFAGRVEFSNGIAPQPTSLDTLDIKNTIPASGINTLETETISNASQIIKSASENKNNGDEQEQAQELGQQEQDKSKDDLDLALSMFPDLTAAHKTGSEHTPTEIHPISIKESEEKEIEVDIVTNNTLSAKVEQPNTDTLSGDYNDGIDPHKFIEWIKAGVISGDMFVNRPNALLHMVSDHLFIVTPNIFKIYLRNVVKRTDTESWELLQKRFQLLGIHRRQHMEDGDSRNIWKCRVAGPNKKSELNGFLIQDPKLLIGDKMFLNNQWLTLLGELK